MSHVRSLPTVAMVRRLLLLSPPFSLASPLLGARRGGARVCAFSHARVCCLFFPRACVQSKKEAKEPKVEEVVKLGPSRHEGEEIFAVAHIYASFNDTFVVSAAA